MPDCHLAWLVDKASAELLENNDSIDEVIAFEGKAWSRDFGNPANFGRIISESTRFVRELRARRFNVALEMQGLFKSGALALLSGASMRIGFNGTREFAESFLTDRIDVGDYFGHMVPVVELNLKIVDALFEKLGLPPRVGAPQFKLPATTETVWQKISALLGPSHSSNVPVVPHAPHAPHAPHVPYVPDVPYIRNASADSLSGKAAKVGAAPARGAELDETAVGAVIPPATLAPDMPSALSSPQAMPSISGGGDAVNPLCVLVPGTTWVTKIWPTESWYELGLKLVDQFNYRLLIIGARSEVEANSGLTARINAARPGAATDLTTKTSLLDLAALFKCCDLVVGGDTGPLHLAAAAQAPRVVGIYGSTPWRRNGPYGVHCRSVSLSLDCQPCYSKHCKIQTIDCLRKLPVDDVIDAVEHLRAGHVQNRLSG